jgi:hypothetical protein
MDISCTDDDYKEMESCIEIIKDKIKLIFDNAILANENIPLEHEYNRLLYVNFASENDNMNCSSSWIKTTNKIILYNYLLFTPTNSSLSECIDYWFNHSIGNYFDDESRIYKDRIFVDELTNINLIDAIGVILKSNIRFESTRYFTDEQDEIKFIQDREQIFKYKFNTKSENYLKYKSTILPHQQINPDFPTIHIGEDGQEQLNLIELFDVFLGISKDSSIWSNPKKYTSMWIEGTNNIFVDLT